MCITRKPIRTFGSLVMNQALNTPHTHICSRFQVFPPTALLSSNLKMVSAWIILQCLRPSASESGPANIPQQRKPSELHPLAFISVVTWAQPAQSLLGVHTLLIQLRPK